MDNPENQSSIQAQLSAVQQQHESLRQVVLSLLLVLLLVSGTLTIFLARQWRFTKNQIELLSPQATQILTEFNRNVPMMQDFVRKLNEYAKTHPDFAPIALRYRLSEVLGKPSASPATNGSPSLSPSNK
jgi:hypothetical protein